MSKWLDELKKQKEEQKFLSSQHKLTPDKDYRGMYYLVHPDWMDRLIEIVERAEWGLIEWAGDGDDGFEVPSCPICTAARNNINDGKHFETCPYSDEWDPSK